MPMSFAALQVYNQYLTTYQSKRSSRYDTHDSEELRNHYTQIQLKNRFAPVYLHAPSAQDIQFAVHLKEQTRTFRNSISALGGTHGEHLFSQKNAYSNEPEIAKVEYTSEHATPNTPTHFTMDIQEFASPQINIGNYLPSNQEVLLPADTYSFDVKTKKLHYELQFNIHEHDTHEILQSKLVRLINQSEIGIKAELITDANRTALQLTSEAMGTPFQSPYHFEITDEQTTKTSGIVNYLGLQKTILPATNATCEVDGETFSSYTNTISLYDAYEVTLQVDKIQERELPISIEIGLYPDMESLSHNLGSFVNGYNSFMENITQEGDASMPNLMLQEEMKKIVRMHRHDLERYGIDASDSSKLLFNEEQTLQSDPVRFADTSTLQSFGNHVLRKLDAIALDPMEYVSRTICAYSNPATPFINPYVTSIYSGMQFEAYC